MSTKHSYLIPPMEESVAVPVILLPADPASFAHNFVSGMQSFYFRESQDRIHTNG